MISILFLCFYYWLILSSWSKKKGSMLSKQKPWSYKIQLVVYSALLFYHSGNIWHLGMNLNPSDGHIMDYTTEWDDGYDIGDANTAYTKDYLSKNVWAMPVNFIGIVRHQSVWILYFFMGIFQTKKGNKKLITLTCLNN